MKRITSLLLIFVCIISFLGLGSFDAAYASESNLGLKTCENLGIGSLKSADLLGSSNMIQNIKDEYESITALENLKSIFGATLVVKSKPEAGLNSDIKVDFDELTGEGTLYLPGGVDTSKLTFSWNDCAFLIASNGAIFKSGDAAIAANNETITYVVKKGALTKLVTIKTLVGSEGVEAMFLTLDEKLGTIKEMNGDQEKSCYGGLNFAGDDYQYISIKGRGNTSWVYSKKPYNITFYKGSDYQKKQGVSLIDGVKSKKWTLIANYDDPTQLRNKVAYDLASKLGIGLDSRYVDVYFNGEYQGLYLLTPKNDYQASDDGYILECDNYVSDEDYQFNLPGAFEAPINGQLNRMTIKEVGDNAVESGITNEKIEEHFLKAWAALKDTTSDEYLKYFDLDSWVKVYLMYEVSKNYDTDSGSIFMHRDGTGDSDLLVAGPIWDFDKCFGWLSYKPGEGMTLSNQHSASGWYIDGLGKTYLFDATYLLKEFGKHDDFQARLKQIYTEYQWAFDEILTDIDEQNLLINSSCEMDDDLYGKLHSISFSVPVPMVIGSGKYQLNYKVTVNRDAKVDNMKEFASKRLLWMYDQYYVGNYQNANLVPENSVVKEANENVSNLASNETLGQELSLIKILPAIKTAENERVKSQVVNQITNVEKASEAFTNETVTKDAASKSHDDKPWEKLLVASKATFLDILRIKNSIK